MPIGQVIGAVAIFSTLDLSSKARSARGRRGRAC
jgi:hypothetical protein